MIGWLVICSVAAIVCAWLAAAYAAFRSMVTAYEADAADYVSAAPCLSATEFGRELADDMRTMS